MDLQDSKKISGGIWKSICRNSLEEQHVIWFTEHEELLHFKATKDMELFRNKRSK